MNNTITGLEGLYFSTCYGLPVLSAVSQTHSVSDEHTQNTVADTLGPGWSARAFTAIGGCDDSQRGILDNCFAGPVLLTYLVRRKARSRD